MLELAKAAQPVTRSEMSRDEAVALFKEKGEDYKVQILESIPGDEVLSFTSRGIHRPLSRPSHSRHGETQSVQAHESGRRLLARGFEQRDAATHLRHCLGR